MYPDPTERAPYGKSLQKRPKKTWVFNGLWSAGIPREHDKYHGYTYVRGTPKCPLKVKGLTLTNQPLSSIVSSKLFCQSFLQNVFVVSCRMFSAFKHYMYIFFSIHLYSFIVWCCYPASLPSGAWWVLSIPHGPWNGKKWPKFTWGIKCHISTISINRKGHQPYQQKIKNGASTISKKSASTMSTVKVPTAKTHSPRRCPGR